MCRYKEWATPTMSGSPGWWGLDGVEAACAVRGAYGPSAGVGGEFADVAVAYRPARLIAGFPGGGGCFLRKFSFGKQFAAVKGADIAGERGCRVSWGRRVGGVPA